MSPTVSVGLDAAGRRVPCVFAGDTPVAEVVRVCHERTIDVGLSELAIAGLDRATLEPLLIYCAEERCVADSATCPGCSKRQEAEGITTFDRFVAGYREIVIGSGEVRIAGNGTEDLQVDSLEALSATWSAGTLLVLGPPRAAQAAPRHPPFRSARRRLRRRGRNAGGAADGAATRRQHRHGGARHGQLRPRRSAPRRPARRLAEREGAHCRLRRQLYHRRRRGLPDARGGDRRLQLGRAPPPRASATCASRC